MRDAGGGGSQVEGSVVGVSRVLWSAGAGWVGVLETYGETRTLHGSPVAVAAFVAAETEKYRTVIRAANIRLK